MTGFDGQGFLDGCTEPVLADYSNKLSDFLVWRSGVGQGDAETATDTSMGSPELDRQKFFHLKGDLITLPEITQLPLISVFGTLPSLEEYRDQEIFTRCCCLDVVLLALEDAQYGIKIREVREDFKTTTRCLVRDTTAQPENFDALIPQKHPAFLAPQMLRRLLYLLWAVDYVLYFQGAFEDDSQVRIALEVGRAQVYSELQYLIEFVVALDYSQPHDALVKSIDRCEAKSNAVVMRILSRTGLLPHGRKVSEIMYFRVRKDTIRMLRQLASAFQEAPAVRTTVVVDDVELVITDYPVTSQTPEQRAALKPMAYVVGSVCPMKKSNFHRQRPPAHQKIFRAFYPWLLQPNRLLPAQARKLIAPLSTNMYVRERAVSSSSGEQPQPVYSVRSGTLVYVGPGAFFEDVRDAVNWKKQQARDAMTKVSGQDVSQDAVAAVSLTSNFPLNGEDKIHYTLHQAREPDECISSIPVNVVGQLQWPKLSRALPRALRGSLAHLPRGRARRFRLAARAQEVMAINQGKVPIVYCASGLDRTGTVEILRAIQALVDAGVSEEAARKAVLRGRHDVLHSTLLMPAAPGLNPSSQSLDLFPDAKAWRLYRSDPNITKRVRWVGLDIPIDLGYATGLEIRMLLLQLHDALRDSSWKAADPRRQAIEGQIKAALKLYRLKLVSDEQGVNIACARVLNSGATYALLRSGDAFLDDLEAVIRILKKPDAPQPQAICYYPPEIFKYREKISDVRVACHALETIQKALLNALENRGTEGGEEDFQKTLLEARRRVHCILEWLEIECTRDATQKITGYYYILRMTTSSQSEDAIADVDTVIQVLRLSRAVLRGQKSSQLTANMNQLLLYYYAGPQRRRQVGKGYLLLGALCLVLFSLCASEAYYDAFGPAGRAIHPLYWVGFLTALIGLFAFAYGCHKYTYKTGASQVVAPVRRGLFEPGTKNATQSELLTPFRPLSSQGVPLPSTVSCGAP